ncbi:hypothetical protein [Planctobacterium marinum]|uniref:hypothetical protein n=1 Tax=Planctobacterium marinum TaxID=1631968 RepID=UPI001E2B9E7B|nr:hypothetical protein [Planctobacterium marinum]MCC2606575.1 hypothetical protein [Planctobacterium marinum]
MSKFELFLRVNINQYSWNGLDNIFIIARIAFQERRKGHFTALIRSILPTLEQIGMQYIGIEAANTASSQFARKIGMNTSNDNRNFYGSLSDIKLALLSID